MVITETATSQFQETKKKKIPQRLVNTKGLTVSQKVPEPQIVKAGCVILEEYCYICPDLTLFKPLFWPM